MRKQSEPAGSGLINRKKQKLRDKVLKPLMRELNQGKSIARLSLAVTLGTAWGMFPLIGTTSLILLLLSFLFRLNHPTVQVFNYLVYPLQIVLLIPFMRLGYFLMSQLPPRINMDYVQTLFDQSWLQAVRQLWDILTHAMLGWFVCLLPLSFVLYFTSVFLMARYKKKKRGKGS